ncbi:uncharacterized protein PHALS_07604 [Plasmopara halstedii]|uniref:Uncharacterized protein n=1 Tax=Plasmopara halstedii TaxID=4781 RepID=A0A0P1B4X4_PLAHL|nr:uncharacterized protein PHALS_07604 [Plasmopara halstedii]CEG49864.1 hypothetical protein PHALS_07604 [Plasmopara halstedii]|eukprot:XP_024586233.1 hypothetical protein PHALS_07604 [Plasmopara halstedii]
MSKRSTNATVHVLLSALSGKQKLNTQGLEALDWCQQLSQGRKKYDEEFIRGLTLTEAKYFLS